MIQRLVRSDRHLRSSIGDIKRCAWSHLDSTWKLSWMSEIMVPLLGAEIGVVLVVLDIAYRAS